MTEPDLSPVHPGEIIREEVLEPLGMSRAALARAIGVDRQRLNEVIQGRRALSADTALRLARYLGTTPEFWLGIQAQYDIERARDALGDRLEREVVPRRTAAE
jgi:addiction module HigA family antidote